MNTTDLTKVKNYNYSETEKIFEKEGIKLI